MASKVSLATLDQKLDSLTKILQDHISKDDEKFDRLFLDNGKPSIFSRINQLEETESRRSSHIKGLWSAFLALLVGIALNWTK